MSKTTFNGIEIAWDADVSQVVDDMVYGIDPDVLLSLPQSTQDRHVMFGYPQGGDK